MDTSTKMQPATFERFLIDRLESMQQFFDEFIERALQANSNQYKNLQS